LIATEPERQERGAFLDAIEGVLKPLMPVVLSYGVGPSDIGQVLKTLYIETLSTRLKDQGRQPTVARLALMAGLNRSEVERLLEAQSERRRLRNQSTAKLDQLSQLLALWHDDSRFSTPYGAPLDLSLEPERNFKTFAELACPKVCTMCQSSLRAYWRRRVTNYATRPLRWRDVLELRTQPFAAKQ